MCKDISSTMSVPEAGPHTPCTRFSAPWTPSSRRQHLPTPTATSYLWTDSAPTWAAPSPTERHPDRTIPPSGTKLPVRGLRKPHRLHRKSRNRNPAETPHSGIRNATRQRSGCHTSAPRMPHASAPDATRQRPGCHTSAPRMPHASAPDATPQHVPSVAFTPVKCGIGRGETIHV